MKEHDVDADRVRILDTTLRDGEQSPGCTMTVPEKLRVAAALVELGVDVIEAGFPIASAGDFEAVQRIAQEVPGPIICALARCAREDIERAGAAVQDSQRSRIHVFLATSAIHREFKLKMDKDQIVRRAVEGVSHARQFTADVEFSAEDASRTEPEFLAEIVEKVIAAGATTINIPDTVGYAMPEQYAASFEYLRKNVRGIERIVLSAHCHDDLGLAVANSLAAVRAGARQVECTINGIGERAGNAALEEIVMAIATRGDYFGAVRTGVKTQRIVPVSRLICAVTGSTLPTNKAIVGENAFAHEAGIHQHGVMENRQTYEIIKPEDVGLDRNRLVLGKHSGRHALHQRIAHLGFDLGEESLERLFNDFKALADKKKHVYDADLEALASALMGQHGGEWSIRGLQMTIGTNSIPTASVCLAHRSGKEVRHAAVGDGPVDAVFKALMIATRVRLELKQYRVRSVTDGQDAQGEVAIDVEHEGQRYHGRAVNTDIIQASAEALLDVINRITRVAQNGTGRGGLSVVTVEDGDSAFEAARAAVQETFR
ncbi:MAG: 2-isopropylmalate synthase [Anaerolineae bacterium]|nr:2-isopropylmalate synthase [Phycisphaerae bacterium]